LLPIALERLQMVKMKPPVLLDNGLAINDAADWAKDQCQTHDMK
jgi:hypothetical protein